MHILVARIETADMARHSDDAGFLGHLRQGLGIRHIVGDGNFDQHVLPRTHHLLALGAVHLRRRGQDHRIGAFDAFGKIIAPMRDAVFLGDLFGAFRIAADQ